MTEERLYYTPFLSLYVKDDWYYFARIPGSAGGVMILVYRVDNQEKPILGRFEICPAHNELEPTLTTIAGGIEKDHTPLQTAVKEVFEEAGYKLDTIDITNLGTCRLSTNQDTIVHLYAADVTGKERFEAPGDGTRGEQGAYCEWVSVEEAVWGKSSYMSTMLLRLFLKTGQRLF